MLSINRASSSYPFLPAIDGISQLHELFPAPGAAKRLRDSGLGPRFSFTPSTVRIGELRTVYTPRSAGIDPSHVYRLTQAEGPLPPIVVRSANMELIDGFHRVAAATKMGRTEIEAYLFDGPDELAFILSVVANISHGLPLPIPDRRDAAARILENHPGFSDRAIASVTGLSSPTVAAVRRTVGDDAQVTKRLGKDGRVRPLNSAAGRRMAAEFIKDNPGASLRQISAAAGVSIGTVRDVRARLARGEGPLLPRPGNDRPTGASLGERWPPTGDAAEIMPVLRALSRDPALRMTCAGRELLKWLHQHAVNDVDTAKVSVAVPDHCIDHVIGLATRCSMTWAKLAHELERRQAMPAGGHESEAYDE